MRDPEGIAENRAVAHHIRVPNPESNIATEARIGGWHEQNAVSEKNSGSTAIDAGAPTGASTMYGASTVPLLLSTLGIR